MKKEYTYDCLSPRTYFFPREGGLVGERQRWHLLRSCQLPTNVIWATINAGTTTVTSIGHSFEPENPAPGTGHPAVVTDFLVNQTQEVGGGAVLPAVTVNLDLDTSISYTITAPAGKKFVIHLPAGSWRTCRCRWLGRRERSILVIPRHSTPVFRIWSAWRQAFRAARSSGPTTSLLTLRRRRRFFQTTCRSPV